MILFHNAMFTRPRSRVYRPGLFRGCSWHTGLLESTCIYSRALLWSDARRAFFLFGKIWELKQRGSGAERSSFMDHVTMSWCEAFRVESIAGMDMAWALNAAASMVKIFQDHGPWLVKTWCDFVEDIMCFTWNCHISRFLWADLAVPFIGFCWFSFNEMVAKRRPLATANVSKSRHWRRGPECVGFSRVHFRWLWGCIVTDRSSHIYCLRSPTVAFLKMQIKNRKRIGIGPKEPKYHHESWAWHHRYFFSALSSDWKSLMVPFPSLRSKLLWVESAGVAAIAFELAAVWEMRWMMGTRGTGDTPSNLR